MNLIITNFLHKPQGKSLLVLAPVIVLVAILQMALAPSASGAATRIAYWRLEESGGPYLDSASGHDGLCAAAGCPTVTAAGQVNNGQQFNGVSSGIDVAAHSDFDWSANESFSIELWVKADPAQTCTGGEEVMIGRSDSGSGSGYWSLGCSSDGQATFQIGNAVQLTSTRVITDGLWHHLVGMRDGSSDVNSLTVDGTEVISETVSLSGSLPPTSADVTLGYREGSFHFTGTLDEVAMYNGLLTETEILEHYYLARGYTNACDTSIRIMPLGDSITRGYGSGDQPTTFEYNVGFRRPLFLTLDSQAYYIDFVGSQIHGHLDSGPAFDYDHEGHGGKSDTWIAANVYDFLDNNPADVILLHIGTNSLHPSPDDIENILDAIDFYSEDITVILARIVDQAPNNSTVTLFNDNVEAMAEARIAGGDKIIIVDMQSALNYSTDMYDTLHPNQSGYDKMATVWLDALDDFMPVCQFAPTITSPPVTAATVSEPYTYDVDATGAPQPTYTLTTKPAGMIIDPDTGEITWTPGSSGSVNVTVRAANSEGFDEQSFTITVTAPEAPEITSMPVESATVGEPYYYDVEASGSPAPTFSLVTKPPGMVIDPDTGVISWTPSSSGSENVTVRATNSEGSHDQDFTITVSPPDAPDITSLPVETATVGELYYYDVEASGSPAPTFSLETAPAGMDIDANTGEITWTPGSAGQVSVTVRATNSGGFDEQPFNITVIAPPSTCPSGMASYWKLDETSGTIFTDFYDNRDALFAGLGSPLYTMGQVNGAVDFDGIDDKLETTTTTNPTDEITVMAWINPQDLSSHDRGILSKENAFVLEIESVGSELAFTILNGSVDEFEPDVPANEINTGQWTHVAATYDGVTTTLFINGVPIASETSSMNAVGDSSEPYAIGWTSHTAFGTDRYFDGRIDDVAVFNVALTDAEIWQMYSKGGVDEVGLCAQAPLITSTPITQTAVNEPYTYTVTASGYPTPTYSLTTTPTTSMTIDANSGVISWTPTATGAYEVAVQADNGASPAATQIFTLNVGSAPLITSTPVTSANVNVLYTYAVTASGTPAPTFSLETAPIAMTIDANSGVISWTPAGTGPHNVVVKSSNYAGSDSQSFTIVVDEEPAAPNITSTAVTEAAINQLYTYDVDASGFPAPTFTLETAPTGMTIDANSGVISWTPGAPGSYNVSVKATNSVSSASQNFTVEVKRYEIFLPFIINP